MRSSVRLAAAAGIWLGTAFPLNARQATPSPKPAPWPIRRPAPIETAADKAKRLAAPSAQHKLLERFLGKWATETRFYYFVKPTEPEKGTAEGTWLIKDRWLKLTWSGPYLARPAEGFMMIGYDNFRMNYVATSVTSLDTAMTRSVGDAIAEGEALLMYGTVDDYDSGEPDRVMKQVWRFVSPDKLVLEVYDMALGETGDKTVDITFIRQP
jgi:hypothetical protein